MTKRWLIRLLWALTGMAWFFWLGIEDRTIYFVLALALLASVSTLVTLPLRRWISSAEGTLRGLVVALIGASAGAAIPLLAVLLMFVKVSLHSHATPDFSLQQVQSVLAVTPVWAAAGGLLAGAWWLMRSPDG